jgi:hypothetical protein
MSDASLSELVESALVDQGIEDQVENPSLEQLIETPSPEVVAIAQRLCLSSVGNEKKLGIRILSELGRPGRPYALQSVEILSELIGAGLDADLLEWALSALGNQHVGRTLPLILSFANHDEPSVRDSVCGAISAAAMNSWLDDLSIDALCRLTRDIDDDVRFSATFELSSWRAQGLNNPEIEEALELAKLDSNPRIAAAADFSN